MAIVSVRMDEELDFYAEVFKEKKSEVIRDLFEEGKKMKAMKLYKEKKVSLGLAAKIAGMGVGEFIDLLGEFGQTLNLELNDAKQAMKFAKELLS